MSPTPTLNPLTNILRIFVGIWLLGWLLRFLAFFLLIAFAILFTPIWLIFKTKFNPWSTVLYPFRKRNKKEWA